MKKSGKFRFGDRIYILLFISINLGLVIIAKRYFGEINQTSTQQVIRRPASDEQKDINELVELADSGSWDRYEQARLEKAGFYMNSQYRPSASAALYFYPETLPDESLEKDFAKHELEPGIKEFKQALKNKESEKIIKAYKRLASRVENYELGVDEDPSELSNEAKKFLGIYSSFANTITKEDLNLDSNIDSTETTEAPVAAATTPKITKPKAPAIKKPIKPKNHKKISKPKKTKH